MKNFNTVKEYLDFLTETDDYMSFTEQYKDLSKSSFWVAANITNIPNIDYILTSKPKIHHSELSTITMLPSEISYHKKHNFSNGYNRHEATSLQKIADLLGFVNPTLCINNQPPGAMMGRHVDTLTGYLFEKLKNPDQVSFNNELRQPADTPPIYRCFVALDDWYPGQIVSFEPYFWTEWQKGDVAFFDWRYTPHATANLGSHDRPFLKITGALTDNSWVEEARLTKQKRELIL